MIEKPAPQKARIVFQSEDEEAFEALTSIVRNEFQVWIERCGVVDDHHAVDLFIVDCRDKPPDTTCRQVPASQILTPRLALIRDFAVDRDTLFYNAFADFFFWPLNPHELRNRITLCLRNPFTAAGIGPRFEDDLVERACLYLVRNIASPIDINTLSKVVGSNRNTVSARFKAALNRTPMSWLRETRMTYALRLIRLTRIPIADIGARVGYEDSNNFSTAFRRAFGVAPSEVRNGCAGQRKS